MKSVCAPDVDRALRGLGGAPTLDWYGSTDGYALELRSLFRPGAGLRYLGHDWQLPAAGHVRADGDDRVVLTRDADGDIRAMANVCPHALRPLVESDTFVERGCVTCPYHQWSFRSDGSFIGGPDAARSIDGTRLHAFDTIAWRGFHFAVDPARRHEFDAEFAGLERAFADRGIADWLDLGGWTVVGSDTEQYRGDWKLFVEVYGDCYHVPPYHPGLASFADCSTLEWSFGSHHHVQFVEQSALEGARSDGYANWMRGLRQYHALRNEPMPTLAVAWAAFYPNLMIEYYAGLRVVSVVVPTGPDTYDNRVHYLVPSDMDALVPGLSATIRAAYDETAEEDRRLVESRHDGIRAAQSLDLPIAAYQPVTEGRAPELGTADFHEWWHRELVG